MQRRHLVILGGGVTGLAAGYASGAPVYEQSSHPGGVCGSYYMVPQSQAKFPQPTTDGECYRFEIGGGHWIFSEDAAILHFIENIARTRLYQRKAAVFFPEQQLSVPYPLQYHLSYLDRTLVMKIREELSSSTPNSVAVPVTMQDWLLEQFGPTLCDLFFFPFHDTYTARLYTSIAPQDTYKTPPDRQRMIERTSQQKESVGYNHSFHYPIDGLNALVTRMAEQCDMRYQARAVRIDIEQKCVFFADGSVVPYERLISTLPLCATLEQGGIVLDLPPAPHTSVLVLNIGADCGPQHPDAHWLYIPRSQSGFHRVGFYSNVDQEFLPTSARGTGRKTALYVERSYRSGDRPGEDEIKTYTSAVIDELQTWGFIGNVDIVDSSWVECAYTWAWPHSRWKKQAINVLESHDIFPVGRYARWRFQGIADSIREGLAAGVALEGMRHV